MQNYVQKLSLLNVIFVIVIKIIYVIAILVGCHATWKMKGVIRDLLCYMKDKELT